MQEHPISDWEENQQLKKKIRGLKSDRVCLIAAVIVVALLARGNKEVAYNRGKTDGINYVIKKVEDIIKDTTKLKSNVYDPRSGAKY